MLCNNCGNTIDDDSKFCEYCGFELPKIRTCPNCGIEVSNNALFCKNCGNELNKESETNDLSEIEEILHSNKSSLDKVHELNELGVLLSKENNQEASLKCFKEALKLDPDSNILLTNAVVASYNIKSYDEGLEYINKLLKSDNSFKNKLLKVRILIGMEEYWAARDYLSLNSPYMMTLRLLRIL